VGYYDLTPEARRRLASKIESALESAAREGKPGAILAYALDPDTHLRKQCALAAGRLFEREAAIRPALLELLDGLCLSTEVRARQTAIQAAGEIGKRAPSEVLERLERRMGDPHPSVRNAVIGAFKQVGQKHPAAVLELAGRHLSDADPEIRREVVHGIELHGRRHPEDVLPLLERLQGERVRRVREMIAHVLSQISYKPGCLPKVLERLATWHDRDLVDRAIAKILEVHAEQTYCELSLEAARRRISEILPEAGTSGSKGRYGD
jgi:HEAT repeat protein